MSNRRHNDVEINLLIRHVFELNERIKRMLHTLDEVLMEVQKESTLIDGVSTLIIGLKGQVAELTAKSGMSPADMAKIDAVFDAVVVNEGKVASAVGTASTGDPVPSMPPVMPIVLSATDAAGNPIA